MGAAKRRLNLLHVPPRLVVARTGEVVARRVVTARTAAAKARGLLGTDELEAGHALVIERARQVHTVGMRYPIDVCFCDRAWTVVHLVRRMRPWRVTKWVARARYVVEAAAGALDGVGPGDQLSLEEPNER